MNWNIENDTRLLKAGTPLMHIIPLSEESFNLEVRTATEKDLRWTKMAKYIKTFSFGPTRQLMSKLYKGYFK